MNSEKAIMLQLPNLFGLNYLLVLDVVMLSNIETSVFFST